MVELMLDQGNYAVDIYNIGYTSYSELVDVVSGENKIINYSLSPLGGAINFSSYPEGATVYVDGVEQTSKTTCIITDVSQGQHIVKLTLSGYNDYTETVTVESGQTTNVNVFLVPISSGGTIQFVTSPDGASVFINGSQVESNTPCEVTGLSPGTYSVRMELSGYENYINNSVVVTDSIIPVVITHMFTPIYTVGILNVKTIPGGASIFIDGSDTGYITNHVFQDVPVGDHTVSLSLSGYMTATISQFIQGGVMNTIEIELEPDEEYPPDGESANWWWLLLLVAGGCAAWAYSNKNKRKNKSKSKRAAVV